MKKIFIPMFAVAALMASSCADEETMMIGNEQVAVLEDVEVDFDADYVGLSKTFINHQTGHVYNFEGNEIVAIYNNYNGNKKTLTNSSKGTSVKLSGANPTVKNATEYYAVMPASAALGKVDNGIVTVSIPTTQKVVEDNFDPAGHLFMSITDRPTKYSFFTANSFLRILNEYGSTLSNITIKFNGVNVVGNYNYDMYKQEFTATDETSDEITLVGDLAEGHSCLVSIVPMENFAGNIDFSAIDEYGVKVVGGYHVGDDGYPALKFERNAFVTIDPEFWEGGEGGEGNEPGLTPATLNKVLFNAIVPTTATKIVFDSKKDEYNQFVKVNGFADAEADGHIEVCVNEQDGTEYYVLSENTIVLPEDCSGLFSGYTSLSTVSFGNCDVNQVVNVASMFSGCSKLYDVQLPTFAKVTDINSMFSGCQILESINFSSMNTAAVTDMHNLFNGCNALVSIIYGDNFKTDEVANMSNMFYGCSKLQTINVSFNTANVTNMAGMFDGCAAVSALDLTSFSFANVTSMAKMFNGCAELKSITVKSDLDIVYTNVADNGSEMFNGCVKLKGGKDTAYDEYHTGVEYARVDEPNSIVDNNKPGYFSVVYVPEPQTLSKRAASHQGFTW